MTSLGEAWRRERAAWREMQFARAELRAARVLRLPVDVLEDRQKAADAAEEAWSRAHGDVDVEEERGR